MKALVTDALGNRAWTQQVTVTIKDGLPTTAIACDGAASPANWVKGPVNVTLTATDGGGGLGATRYTLTEPTQPRARRSTAAPFSLAAAATVKFRSWNAAGNAEPVAEQELSCASTPLRRRRSSPRPPTAQAYAGAVTVKVTATDSGSGVSGVELYTDGDSRLLPRSELSYELVLSGGPPLARLAPFEGARHRRARKPRLDSAGDRHDPQWAADDLDRVQRPRLPDHVGEGPDDGHALRDRRGRRPRRHALHARRHRSEP